MKAYIWRNGHDPLTAPYVGVDQAGNTCAIVDSLDGAIEEAGQYSIFHHREKVSIEIVGSSPNKKFDKAMELLDAKIAAGTDFDMLRQVRAAREDGSLWTIVDEVLK